MKIHVISETPFIMKATGVHTAFMDHIELLKEKDLCLPGGYLCLL